MGAALAVASIAASVGGQLFAGFSAKKAADAEAESIESQAALEREENLEETRRQRVENRKFLAKQSVMFIKGGVSLEGSPLLVLEETKEEGEKQFAAGKRRAEARFGFGLEKAERVEAQGRAKLIGGIFGGISSGLAMTMKARQLKIF